MQRNSAQQASRYTGVAGLPHHSSLPGQRVRGIYGATLHVCSGVSSRIVDVNCGTYATFATTADGHIFAFGLNNYGQLALPGELSSLVVRQGWDLPTPAAVAGRDCCSGDTC